MTLSSGAGRLFVVTGGPGSGKTTLIEALSRAGFACSQEAGRQIIREQTASGGQVLPWVDPAAFAEAMLRFDMQSYAELSHGSGTAFFDRGIPDAVGYLRLLNLPVPPHMERAAADRRYDRRVFIAPPWPEIFSQDEERKQDLDEAERTYGSMVATYTNCGYELIELPKVSVEERVRFVLNAIGGTVS